ncbi:MAG: DUF4340 domain-containing protein [Candidatus Binatia bacterium]
MTWRRAAVYWACFLVLGVYYAAVEREPAGQAAAHLTRAPFLSLSEDQIDAIEVRRGDRVVRCRRIDRRWKVVEPAEGVVPSDLVAGLIDNLTRLPDVEVVAEKPGDLTQFGLDAPASQLVLTPASGTPVTVRLGNRNPSGTAVYAQRGTSDRVFLIGLNARYYEDLLFEALRQNRG